jgi:hypothetical protein
MYKYQAVRPHIPEDSTLYCRALVYVQKVKKGKAIPVTGNGGPCGCETSRLPHFLDSRLTDGGEVSLKRRPPLTPQEDP